MCYSCTNTIFPDANASSVPDGFGLAPLSTLKAAILATHRGERRLCCPLLKSARPDSDTRLVQMLTAR